MVGKHEYFIKKGAVAKVEEVAKGGGVSAGQASSSGREMSRAGGLGEARSV